MIDVLADCGHKLAYVVETAPSDALVCEFSKPTFHPIQPGARCREEVQMDTRMPPHPGVDARMLVGSVVVDDQMQIKMGRRLGVDLLEESDELLVPMTRHAVANDFPIEQAQRREQGRRAMAFVVVRHRPAAAFLHRKARLGSVEGLDLALLIDGEHQGLVRGIEVEPNHVIELLDKLCVAADLERSEKMGFEPILLPDAANGGFTDPLSGRQSSGTPMSRSGRRCVQGRLNNGADFPFWNAWDATGTWGIVFESSHAQSQKPCTP